MFDEMQLFMQFVIGRIIYALEISIIFGVIYPVTIVTIERMDRFQNSNCRNIISCKKKNFVLFLDQSSLHPQK